MLSKNSIVKKICLKGVVEVTSPLHIGSGKAETTEMDIIRDSKGDPYIPATSLIGVLRHAFPLEFHSCPSFKAFWGYSEQTEGRQSAVCCKDLTLDIKAGGEGYAVSVRDGVKIANNTGCAEETGKFDIELVDKGARFNLDMEITVREQDEDTIRYVRTVYKFLVGDNVALGAKTNNGLGQIRLLEDSCRIAVFDFTIKKDVRDWLLQDFSDRNSSVESLGKPFVIEHKICRLHASLRLKHSLLVRSRCPEPELPDAVQLQSGDNWILPGSSIRGALRARAERIVKILDREDHKRFLDDLFGYVEGKNGKKGRLRINDVCLEKEKFPSELQTRIRIDRFTGGVINGGLFDSMPVYAGKDSEPVEFSFTVTDPRSADIGLLLLLLKDLWAGDLAIGGEKNIGRGVFSGVAAELAWDNQKISLDANLSRINNQDRQTLQGFVDSLRNQEKTP